jgi:protein Xni
VSIKVLLIDTFNLIRRIYEAGQARSESIEMIVEASRRSLEKALRQHQPSHAISVVDSHETTWRHSRYPGYKAGRAPTPEMLMAHLDDFKSVFASLGVASLEQPHLEADDVIGTLAQGIAGSGGQVVILSTDKGFLPLLSDQVQVYHHFEQCFVSPADVQARFALRIDQLADFWALAGDPTNSIKGVPRVGKKTAIALLHTYDSLAAILAAEASDPLVARVQADAESAQCCRELTSLKTDLALGVNLKSYRL